MLDDFHFLRPAWLWIVLPTLLLNLLWWRASSERQWRRLIAPHLLTELRVGGGRGFRFRPKHLISAVLLLGAFAAAGPTWEREPSPFAEDTAPLVIALDLSSSMNAIDVQPTRLERAKQKIRDLLAIRTASRTALIAYAGSAHTVLPLSDDASVFEMFVVSLATGIMPMPGKDPAKALAMAEDLLSREEAPGSILFFTDGIGVDQVASFAEHAERSSDAVMVLAIGTTEGGPIRAGANSLATDASGRRIMVSLDREGLDALSRETGAFVGSVTVDDADVNRVQRHVQSNLQQVQQEDATARWRDFGYYLMFPLALLSLLWFRKGWTVRWSAVLLVVACVGCSPDLWLTPDQQGRRAFEDADFETAAELFEDPWWRGTARYRDGDFEGAVTEFARFDTPEATFNSGNAYARLGSYPEAVASYEQALAGRPGWRQAQENRSLVHSLIAAEPDDDEQLYEGGEPALPPDEIQFDEQGEQGERGEVDVAKMTDDQLTEMWMRRLSTSPADFLRFRFASEASRQQGDPQ